MSSVIQSDTKCCTANLWLPTALINLTISLAKCIRSYHHLRRYYSVAIVVNVIVDININIIIIISIAIELPLILSTFTSLLRNYRCNMSREVFARLVEVPMAAHPKKKWV
ncbi:hypothetical protein B0H65DRAFT_440987 [Neurospora tetraspora]|uniref:Uncharacterized protein n=1 Tax=Neurospora tetraspora TaxID=94610 RepID=A0AAE0JH04_9PEZI|nr:hypothetical protein B0H65DRAFT_440987 [Neurospora tetraspora]